LYLTKTSCYRDRVQRANGILRARISRADGSNPALKKNFQNGIRLLTSHKKRSIIRRVWVVGG
jgi:hypothetical protein